MSKVECPKSNVTVTFDLRHLTQNPFVPLVSLCLRVWRTSYRNQVDQDKKDQVNQAFFPFMENFSGMGTNCPGRKRFQ
jgi:hypothetical protein